MKYEDVKAQVFASGSVPDGYFGDRKRVQFAWIPSASGKILVVTDRGFYDAGLPRAMDEDEALWLLQNHPTAKHMRLIATPAVV